MASLEERVSRLEGAGEHMATKADVADAKAELKADIARSKVDTIKWVFGIVFGAAALATSAALLFQRIFG